MFTATTSHSIVPNFNVAMTPAHIRKLLLKEEEGLFDQHFGSFSNKEEKVPEKLIKEVVQKSKRMFFVSDDGFLWAIGKNAKGESLYAILSPEELARHIATNSTTKNIRIYFSNSKFKRT